MLKTAERGELNLYALLLEELMMMKTQRLIQKRNMMVQMRLERMKSIQHSLDVTVISWYLTHAWIMWQLSLIYVNILKRIMSFVCAGASLETLTIDPMAFYMRFDVILASDSPTADRTAVLFVSRMNKMMTTQSTSISEASTTCLAVKRFFANMSSNMCFDTVPAPMLATVVTSINPVYVPPHVLY